MAKSRWFVTAVVSGAFLAGFALRGVVALPAAQAQIANRVFEIRTYTAPPGRLEALKARFRDHTIRLFNKHGMTSIGYWTPLDPPQSENTLTYILAYPSREAAVKSWAAFNADPDWQAARKTSQADGPLVTGVTSVYMAPADFSAIK
jgi:NIPSNAP